MMRTAILAHSRRSTIYQTIETLLASGLIEHVCVVTTDDDLQFSSLAYPRVRLLRSNVNKFCKATLLNEALSQVTEGYVLVSDADILWAPGELQKLFEDVEHRILDFSCVEAVSESIADHLDQSEAPYRRLSFRVVPGVSCAEVEISYAAHSLNKRPGYGLLYGSVASFRAVGGYKSHWGGSWGWEDVDFLIRAQLLGFCVEARGEATHLTHGDDLRALAGLSKAESRDANIVLCREDICAGRWLGDLAIDHNGKYPQAIWRDLRCP